MEETKIDYDFIVVGAGYGGLTAAALLAKENYNVLILESHYSIGGCASFFKRNGHLFDVGATTLSGYDYNGPLKRIEEELGFNLKVKRIDPGMIIHFNGKKIHRYREFNKWINELDEHFPGIDHRAIWSEIEKIGEKAWRIINDTPLFPPSKAKDLLSYFNKHLPKYLDLLPFLFKSFISKMPKNAYQNKEYVQFLDQILMITNQGKSKEVPYLMGALGLNYPKDTLYSCGGMVQMAHKIEEKLKEHGGKIKKRRRVYSIQKEDAIFRVEANFNEKKEFYYSKNIICNLPIWNIQNMCEGNLKKYFEKKSKTYNKSWGAMTYYFTVKFQRDLDSLYHQVHLKELDSFINSESLFYSFSDKGDISRNKSDSLSVTVSTHISNDEFEDMKKNIDEKKIKFEEIILDNFKKTFKDYGIITIGKGEVGTPLTFEKYTGRHKGRVGGIPHLLDYYPFFYPSCLTPDPNFFRVGDTVFPGQGVVGVVSGAFSLVHRILKS